MKLAVYNHHRVGLVEGDLIYDVTAAVPDAGPDWPPVYMSRLIAQWETRRADVIAARAAAKGVPLSSVTLMAPNPCPVQVIAAPVNYQKHIGEIGARSVSKGRSPNEMGFFMKATASIVGAGGAISLPKDSTRRIDHESELAVVISRTARNVSRADAMNYVFGYACLIDVTMRLEPGVKEEERVTRKSFETFTPLGPWIVTADELTDPHVLRNRLWVNDELRQDANTSALIVDVPGLIELVTSVVTLNPGDVIATGTPEGVGQIKVGDKVRIEIEGVGAMTLPVVEDEAFAPRRF
ncbi:MAG: putative 2-keto-4-pentenoate hydratase/2-oxohepta-3-ene,7-dioic acid hydratase [Rhizobacter sp.]|nr:putative 2-keto-4-pentenoate hydratase/2-oxohepta-3-ene,7-dioic acid hydratase [Rhizobacter sp.]